MGIPPSSSTVTRCLKAICRGPCRWTRTAPSVYTRWKIQAGSAWSRLKVGESRASSRSRSSLAIVGVNFVRNSALLFDALASLIEKDIRTRGEFQLTDAFSLMVERGAHLETFAVDNWFDCGAPDALLETNRHLLERLPRPKPGEGPILIPPVYVSPSATVENSILGPYVSVGDAAIVTDAIVRDSIIGEGAQVSGCFLEKSLVGSNAVVASGPRKLNVGDSSEVSLY